MKIAVVDCLATGSAGRRLSSVDVVGSGPRLVVGILTRLGVKPYLMECERVLSNSTDILRNFDVLMVSGMSSDIHSVSIVLKKWKERGPSLAGGPMCVDYEDLLKLGFTAVVWGEAEVSLPVLVKTLGSGDFRNIPNLIFRENGEFIVNITPSYAREPLLWSFEPDVESIRNYRYYWARRVYVEVVRGCSNFYRTTLPIKLPKEVGITKCVRCGICRTGRLELRVSCPLGIPPGCGYCLVPRLYGPARSRPVEQIVKEVSELIELGVTRIVLSAPDILDYGRDWLVKPSPLTDPRYPPANVGALEQLLSDIFSIPTVEKKEVYVMVENIKPNLVTEEVARVLGKYLRGTTVNIGLETGDSEHHVELGRPSTVEEVLRAIKLLRDHGLRPYVYTIYGLPGESWRTIRNTIKVLKKATKLGAERVILYRFRPLRGSAFENYPHPSLKNRRVSSLKSFVEALEASFKKKLLGKTVRIAVVDTYSKDIYIGYTLPHGPVALLKSSKDLRGRVVDAVVLEVEKRKIVCTPLM